MASIHLILIMLRRDHTYQLTAMKVYRIISFLLQLVYVNVYRNTVFHFSSLFQRWHFASSVVFRQVIGKDKVKVKSLLVFRRNNEMRCIFVEGTFVTRDRPFFPVKCEMANFFLVNRDFLSSREA